MRFFTWAVTLVASCIALLVLIAGVVGAKGAPQEAAAAAIAAALCIIPYVFSRAIEKMLLVKEPEKLQAQQLAAMLDQSRLLDELVSTVAKRPPTVKPQ